MSGILHLICMEVFFFNYVFPKITFPVNNVFIHLDYDVHYDS